MPEITEQTTHKATEQATAVEQISALDQREESVFQKLTKELGDHHGLVLFNYHIADLPFIFYDVDGWHFYWSEHQLEESGIYTLHEGHPIRKDTGAPPTLDLSITNFVAFQWFAIIVAFVIVRKAAKRYLKDPLKPPKGWQNALEALLVYIRDKIAYATIPDKKVADSLLPYLASLFCFILLLNLFGLLPGGHTATSSLSVTGGMALLSFILYNGIAIVKRGFKHWAHHFLAGAPVFLAPIMVPIEILGNITRAVALAIRLFANMTAGHLVLYSLIGIILFFETVLVSPFVVGFSVFIYFLELLVAFIQAYIFTILTALFIGLNLGGEHEH